VAALLFAGMAGETALPDPIDVDPGSLSDDERHGLGIRRLPATLADAVSAFEADIVLPDCFGAPLATTLMDVRKAEIQRFAGSTPDQITAAYRWAH
jgi:glutamine synthetase